MRIFNIVNIELNVDRIKEFCINNFNSVSASIKSIIDQVRLNRDNIIINSNNISELNSELNSLINDGGSYTPTATIITNVTTVIPRKCIWSRKGNFITLSGAIAINPTAAPGDTHIRFSLPIASNFSTTYDGSGVATEIFPIGTQNQFGIYADITNNQLNLRGHTLVSGVTLDYYFVAQYQVI